MLDASLVLALPAPVTQSTRDRSPGMEAGGAVPLIDGLPATYNQSLDVTMSVDGMRDDDAVFRIAVASDLIPDAWSVVSCYEDFKVLRKSLISDFDMKVVGDLNFPGDKKDKLMSKANQAAKKDTTEKALNTAEKRVGELQQWLTLVLCYCPDLSALDAFLEMSPHLNPEAFASPAPAPASVGGGGGGGWGGAASSAADPWAEEAVPVRTDAPPPTTT